MKRDQGRAAKTRKAELNQTFLRRADYDIFPPTSSQSSCGTMDNLTQDFDDLMSPSKQFQSSTQELEITGSKAESTQTEWTFSKLQGKTDKKLPDTTYKRRLNQAKDVVMAVAYRHNLTYYELLGHLIMHESYISGRTTYYPAGEAIAEGKPLGTKNISIYKCLWLWERCEMTKRNWQNARNLLLLDKVVLKPENVLRDIRNKMCPKIDVWHPISGPNRFELWWG